MCSLSNELQFYKKGKENEYQTKNNRTSINGKQIY